MAKVKIIMTWLMLGIWVNGCKKRPLPLRTKIYLVAMKKDWKIWSLASVRTLISKRVSKDYSAFHYPIRTPSSFENFRSTELEGGLGMFSEGYGFGPLSKLMKLYGTRIQIEGLQPLVKGTNKRFTGRIFYETFAGSYLGLQWLLLGRWDNLRVRRLASECIRIFFFFFHVYEDKKRSKMTWIILRTSPLFWH